MAFAHGDRGAASGATCRGMVIERMPPGVAPRRRPRVWLTGLTVGAPLLRIGQIRMTDTSLGLVFVQYHPTVAEMSDVLLIRL